jgi:adenine-specific DNA methylase
MVPNADRTGVLFGVENDVPVVGGNAAQRREHDKRRGAGTMTRSGAQCPCCPTIMTMEDLRLESRARKLSAIPTAVVVDGPAGKEYRLPTDIEIGAALVPEAELDSIFSSIAFGVPYEETPYPAGAKFNSSSLRIYGFDSWRDIFTNRQLVGLATLIKATTDACQDTDERWRLSILAYLACVIDKVADYSSSLCTWHNSGEKLRNVFTRYALPVNWDYTEVNILSAFTGAYAAHLEWVAGAIEKISEATSVSTKPTVVRGSAISSLESKYDAIITDPPYYDAIAYADIMDFFYVWLRRTIFTVNLDDAKGAFDAALSPKWNPKVNDGELIDNPTLYDKDKTTSRLAYEDGMRRAFQRFYHALEDGGRLVLVFANKNPIAWESLVGSLVSAGFIVDGSWPVQTEMANRTRALASAALSSSIWLVCKKRPLSRPGWDTAVLTEMRERIHAQLRTFWDAGIRGPDFVWAATGPALEAFSKYPVVKKADEPNAQMTVSEFLREVRRIVVDFVVGRVLTHNGDAEAASGLDDITTYYLLHRNDFSLDDAPIGACILYALSCNLSDSDLADRFDVLSRSGGTLIDDLEGAGDGDDEDAADAEDADSNTGGKGNKVKLKPWNQRKAKWLGYEGPGGRPVPLIDQAHRLMHLWRAGEEAKVDEYLETRGLKRNALFAQLLQALIELSATGSEERSILESLSNHIASRGGISAPRQIGMEV